MDRNEKKKSKIKVDKSAKNAIFQLVYDFLKRDNSVCEVAELLKKKTNLVVNFSLLFTERVFVMLGVIPRAHARYLVHPKLLFPVRMRTVHSGQKCYSPCACTVTNDR